MPEVWGMQGWEAAFGRRVQGGFVGRACSGLLWAEAGTLGIESGGGLAAQLRKVKTVSKPNCLPSFMSSLFVKFSNPYVKQQRESE